MSTWRPGRRRYLGPDQRRVSEASTSRPWSAKPGPSSSKPGPGSSRPGPASTSRPGPDGHRTDTGRSRPLRALVARRGRPRGLEARSATTAALSSRGGRRGRGRGVERGAGAPEQGCRARGRRRPRGRGVHLEAGAGRTPHGHRTEAPARPWVACSALRGPWARSSARGTCRPARAVGALVERVELVDLEAGAGVLEAPARSRGASLAPRGLEPRSTTTAALRPRVEAVEVGGVEAGAGASRLEASRPGPGPGPGPGPSSAAGAGYCARLPRITRCASATGFERARTAGARVAGAYCLSSRSAASSSSPVAPRSRIAARSARARGATSWSSTRKRR